MNELAHRKPSYEELEEEILQLKEELGLTREKSELARVYKALGLTLSETLLILCLYRSPAPVRLQRLNLLSRKYEDHEDSNVVPVRISHIRKKLDFDVIETYKNFGYALSFEGRQRVKEALGE